MTKKLVDCSKKMRIINFFDFYALIIIALRITIYSFNILKLNVSEIQGLFWQNY